MRDGLREPRLAWLILAISWFWMVGVGMLIQLPLFVRSVLAGNEQALAGALAIFTIGIAVGAFLCNRLYAGRAQATFAPLAAAALGAGFLLLGLVPMAEGPLRGFGELLQDPQAIPGLVLLLLVAIAGGFYVTPLYALLQQRAQNERRARVIACNNILNSLLMATMSITSIIVFQTGGTIVTVWGVMATTAAIAALALLAVQQGPHMLLRLVASVTRVSKPPPDGAVVFVRRASVWTAWALAATTPGKPRLIAPMSLERHPLMRLLALWTGPERFDGEDAEDCTLLVLPPEGQAGEDTLLTSLHVSTDRPVAVAAVADPGLYMPARPRPHIEVAFQHCAVSEREEPRRTALVLYDTLCELEYRLHCRETTTLQSLYGAAQRFGASKEILADPQRTLTYRKLLQAVHAIALLLERTLPKEPSTVGLLLPNVAATPITFLATHAMQRVPVMLNYTAGPANLISACRTAGVTHIVTSRQFIEKAELGVVAEALQKDHTLVWLEDLRAQLTPGMKLTAAWRARRRPTAGDPSDPAVVLFTSGSEGEPKGVLLSHRNLQRNRCQVRAVLNLGPDDRLLLCLPLFHSFALGVGMLLPLMAGLHCSLYPSPLHYKEIPKMIRERGITVFFSTDTFLNGYGQNATREDLRSLRWVVAGAEPLKAGTREFWWDHFGVTVHEGYGVTETSPAVSTNTDVCFRHGTVGRLMPAIEARLEPLEDDPGGHARGRLFLRGPNVMMGYWLPGDNGLLTPPENGWHDTGDIAEFDADGFLSLHGRAKRFAKIGGEMVSLVQVEQVISDLWPEHLHLVCAVAHATHGEQLVLLTEHPALDRKQLRTALADKGLAELARPRHILAIEALPLLGSGKPDLRRAQEIALKVLH